MREILFRGKRIDNDEWVEGCYLYDKKYDKHYITEVGTHCGEVIPETVGQYTGVTDKNGKRIFEGDIVQSQASDNQEDWKNWRVEYVNGSFVFTRDLPRKKHKYEENLLCEEEIELYGLAVIGNIHDSPELLEERE